MAQTLVNCEVNREVQVQSVGAGVEDGRGHPKERLADSGLKEGTSMVAGVGDGGGPRREQSTVGMAKSELNESVYERAKLS